MSGVRNNILLAVLCLWLRSPCLNDLMVFFLALVKILTFLLHSTVYETPTSALHQINVEGIKSTVQLLLR